MYLSRGCLVIFTLRDAIIPLVRRFRVLHPAQHDLLDNHPGNRAREKKRNGTLWLSSSRSDWHVLQRCCQLTPRFPNTYIKCFTASNGANHRPTVYHIRVLKGDGGEVTFWGLLQCVIRLSLGKSLLLVNLLHMVKRTNTPLNSLTNGVVGRTCVLWVVGSSPHIHNNKLFQTFPMSNLKNTLPGMPRE